MDNHIGSHTITSLETLIDIDAPIGIFDSGLGGLTVARELSRVLPQESLVYLGDTLRCPYGPRDLAEVRTFVQQICSFLANEHVKLIVIACNTGTAAGLATVQKEFDIPIIGVVEPGARAAVQVSQNRRIGVIGTKGTIDSGSYERALKTLDAGLEVFSVATPRFVDIVEEELGEGEVRPDGELRIHDNDRAIANEYLLPLKKRNVDTLILGCTHYPLLMPLIGEIMGPDIQLISSAEETASEVQETLERRGHLHKGAASKRVFYTTGDVGKFKAMGTHVFGSALEEVAYISTAALEEAQRTRNIH